MILLNLTIFYTRCCIFRFGYLVKLCKFVLLEGGWDTGLASFYPNILTEIIKASQKNSAKSESGKFTSMEKYSQLLFIKCIWQSQKFVKPSYTTYLPIISNSFIKNRPFMVSLSLLSRFIISKLSHRQTETTVFYRL